MNLTRLSIAAAALALTTGGLAVQAVPSVAAEGAVAAEYHVTLKLSARTVVAREDKVRLKGAVTPKPPAGSKVVLQVRYENQTTWKRVGATLVKADGTYRFVEKPNSRLDRVYRVVKAADAKAAADKSPVRGLNVLAWRWLASFDDDAASGFFHAGSAVPINGTTYDHSFIGSSSEETGFREITLGRTCSVMQGTFGLSDFSESGGQATLKVLSDGATAYEHAFGIGQSELKVFDVAGVFRVRIEFNKAPATPPSQPAVGAGRVLCD